MKHCQGQRDTTNKAQDSAERTHMKIYVSNYRENKENTYYPQTVTIKTIEDLKAAARYDHIFAMMKDSKRGKGNYIVNDCLILDLDNTHSNEAEAWKSLDDVTDVFPEVHFFYIKSRNYMKAKTKKGEDGTITQEEPREKFHFYMPLSSEIRNLEECKGLLRKICAVFPFFDTATIEPNHFFFGVQDPEGEEIEGSVCIDQYINDLGEDLKKETAQNMKDYAEKMETGIYKQDKANKLMLKIMAEISGKELPQSSDPEGSGADLAEASGHETQDPDTDWIDNIKKQRSVNWFEKWAKNHNVDIKRIYKINDEAHPQATVYCVDCPWKHEHSADKFPDNESVVIIDKDGRFDFLCRHSHGADLHWKDYRAEIERLNPAPDEGQEEKIPLPLSVKNFAEEFKQHRQEFKQNLRSGFKALDISLGGGFSNELYIMAAQTGTGKSAIASIFAQNIAESGTDVLYYALEMSQDEFIARGASAISVQKYGTGGKAIKYGEIINDYYDYKLDQFLRRPYSQYEPFVDEYMRKYGEHLYFIEGGINGSYARKIAETVRQFKKEKNIKRMAVFIDYLQLLDADPKDKTQRDKMTIMSSAVKIFKSLASQEGATVFLISSMPNNKTGSGVDDTSFKYSGDISFTGGVLLGWNWKGVTDSRNEEDREFIKQQSKYSGVREMILEVMKHRNNERDNKIRLAYYPAYNYIIEDVGNKQARPAARQEQDEGPNRFEPVGTKRGTKRAKDRERLFQAFEAAQQAETFDGTVTVYQLAEELGITQKRVINMIKEYGGYKVEKNGKIVISGEVDTSASVKMMKDPDETEE